VWKDYIDSKNDYSYYGDDGFHPSERGSEVAAKVIYNTLFGG
jgi:lysophospholipase L1-like esterase